MKYLRSEEVEKLSPVKRLYYEKRLKWERERIADRIEPVLPTYYVPGGFMTVVGPYGNTGWVERRRVLALTTAFVTLKQDRAAIKQFLEEMVEES